jgi:hypothetical protein
MKIQLLSTKVKDKTKYIKYKQPKRGASNITTFQTTKLQVQLKFSEIKHYLLHMNWSGAGYTFT